MTVGVRTRGRKETLCPIISGTHERYWFTYCTWGRLSRDFYKLRPVHGSALGASRLTHELLTGPQVISAGLHPCDIGWVGPCTLVLMSAASSEDL